MLKNKNNEKQYLNIKYKDNNNNNNNNNNNDNKKNNIKNNHNKNKNEKKIFTKIYRFTGEIKLKNELISMEKANLEKNSKLIFVNEKDCNDYQQVDLSDFIVRRSQIKNPLLSLNLSLNYSLNPASSSSSPPPSPPASSPSPSSSSSSLSSFSFSLLSSHSSS